MHQNGEYSRSHSHRIPDVRRRRYNLRTIRTVPKLRQEYIRPPNVPARLRTLLDPAYVLAPHRPLRRVNLFHTLSSALLQPPMPITFQPHTPAPLCIAQSRVGPAPTSRASERMDGTPCALTAYCACTADIPAGRKSVHGGLGHRPSICTPRDGRTREERRVRIAVNAACILESVADRSLISCVLVAWARNPTGRCGRGRTNSMYRPSRSRRLT